MVLLLALLNISGVQVGATGIVRPLLRALGPITVAANIGVLVRRCEQRR
jgi:hypothetical protein